MYIYKTKKNTPNPSFYVYHTPHHDEGITVYRSPQCPYTKGMQTWVQKFGEKHNIQVKVIEITDHIQAQNALYPYGTFYVTYNGKPFAYETNTKDFVKRFELI